MSNTISEDLLVRCLKVKEIIDASIARIDSIRNDKAKEEISAKEAKESSYEGANNIIGKENGSKKEKNKQPTVGPTRSKQNHDYIIEWWKRLNSRKTLLSQQVEPKKVLVVCWEKFVAAHGTNKTHKLALASDFQEGLIRPLMFWKNSQNNTMATTNTTWCLQKGFNEEHGIREFRIIQNITLRTRGRNNNHRKKKTTDTGTCSASGSDGILNDATYRVDAAIRGLPPAGSTNVLKMYNLKLIKSSMGARRGCSPVPSCLDTSLDNEYISSQAMKVVMKKDRMSATLRAEACRMCHAGRASRKDLRYQKRKYVRTCGVSQQDETYDREHRKEKYDRTCRASRKDRGYQKGKYVRTEAYIIGNKG
nr:hypothetical protein [Tanacetum cinerariifolium]